MPYQAAVRAGERFGRLVVVREAEKRDALKRRHYTCRCDCGKETTVRGDCLRRSDGIRSCGCLRAKKPRKTRPSRHGHTKNGQASRTYVTWMAMKGRCDHKSNASWENYGGRGITVCTRWRESFESFLSDMGERPEGMSIDRIDVNGNYEPGNCRWATPSEQNLNRR